MCLSLIPVCRAPSGYMTGNTSDNVYEGTMNIQRLGPSFNSLSEVNFCVLDGPHLIPSDSNVHLGSTACCLEWTMVWRGRAAHTDRELTTVFTGQRLHFQMTADNCFTWPWLLWPAERDLTCQVRFTGVNDGEFQSLFGVLESDSTSINQCDMWLSLLQDKRLKALTLYVQI